MVYEGSRLLLQLYTGPARDVLLVLDAISTFICIELSVSFFSRSSRRNRAWQVNLGWGIVFALFGLMQGLIIPFAYYLPPTTYTDNQQWLSGGGVFIIVAVIVMFEYFYQKFARTKYIISLIGIVTGVFYFINTQLGSILFGTYFLVLFVFTASFFTKLIRLSSGSVRTSVIFFTVSFYTLMSGNFFVNLDTMLAIQQMGLDTLAFGLVGRLIKLVCYLAIYTVLEKLPIFMEVNWRENLDQVYIIHRGAGIPIFHTKFGETAPAPNAPKELAGELVAGGIVGITAMLKEISQSTETMKLFDHGDVKILCEYGENVLIVLYAKVEFHIYWEKLAHLRATVEELFGTILQNWSGGNLAIFDPIVVLVKNEFR